MAVASGIIVAWPSTIALIPSGWTRETNLDSKYIQGAPTGGDTDLTARGAATHTHTSPTHTPIQNSHSHVYTLNTSSGNVQATAGAVVLAIDGHTHAGTSSSVVAVNTGVAITVNANSSNDLAYQEVIFIKSDGTPTGIPDGAYAFYASDSLPSGWSRVLGNTYLKGAAAAGNGGATGGSNTHTHTSPAHTHGQSAHTHPAANSGVNSGPGSSLDNTFGGSFGAHQTHVHAVDLNSSTGVNQSVTTTLSTDSHEPVFKKLNTILKGAGGDSLPTSIIAIWGGNNGNIPSSWSRFTSMDGNFLKGANANGESNVTTGGSLTHTHTASNCLPTQNTHTHTANVGLPDVVDGVNDSSLPGDPFGAADIHTHTVSVVAARPTNQTTVVTIDPNTSESGYPPYVRVIFIQFSATPSTVTGRTTYDYGFSQSPGKQSVGYRHEDIIEKRIWRGERRHGPYS